MFKKRGKRGISPLIATVLLIAFAVSLGTMIMSWGTDMKSGMGDCENVKIELQAIAGKPFLCYEPLSTNINFILINKGEVDIKYLKLATTGLDYTTEELEITSSAVKAGGTLNKNVEYVKSGTFKVELIPVIFSGGKDKICRDKSISAESIERCNG
jgi:flagellin-like protein